MRIDDFKTGDIFITRDGKKRMIVGGNVSYGIKTFVTIDLETCEIKSRLCRNIESLMNGYDIVSYAPSNEVSITVENLTEVEFCYEEEDEEVSISEVDELFSRVDIVEQNDEYDDEDDEDNEY